MTNNNLIKGVLIVLTEL